MLNCSREEDMTSAIDDPRFEHPGVWIGLATLAFASSAIVAARDRIPEWEIDLTTAINELPDVVATLTWPVMQLGSFVAPIAIGGLALVLGRRRLAVNVTVAGLAAWSIAKGIKELFGRERPTAYLPEIIVREGDGSGLGYVSGHSAVAAACVTCLVAALPARWRPIAIVAASVTGIARIVHGVHFPADVIGGWSLGQLQKLNSLFSSVNNSGWVTD